MGNYLPLVFLVLFNKVPSTNKALKEFNNKDWRLLFISNF